MSDFEVLSLLPKAGKSRNSEGAFDRLLPEKLIDIYSRYCGGIMGGGAGKHGFSTGAGFKLTIATLSRRLRK